MNIFGINYLSESSVCLIKNNNLIFAISEERINRKKNWYGIPSRSIDLLLKINKLKIKDIDFFTTTGNSVFLKNVPEIAVYKKKEQEIKDSNLSNFDKNKQINNLKCRFDHEVDVIRNRTSKYLKLIKKKYKKLIVYDHHTSHAASAAFLSGFKSCYVLTADGWGDNASSKLFLFKNGELKQLSQSSTLDSLGYFYGSITKLLGFKPHQHEGKVLGLAAYGDYKSAYKDLKKMISFSKKENCFKGHYENGLYVTNFNNENLLFLKKKYSKEDIAAAAQKVLENCMLKFISNINFSGKKINLALAGGIFSNVKLNQKINELKIINKIFIFPNMGDGGLAVGSALLKNHENNKKYKILNNVYLSNKFDDNEILREINKNHLKYSRPKNIEKIISRYLVENKIIAHFNCKMEFGPRALGNRSILCSAANKDINNLLNNKLGRTEFMPFAPIIMDKYAKKFLKNIKDLTSYKYMTITSACKKIMIKNCPAAVHVDNTARPQIVTSKDNIRIYKILKEYYNLTGVPVLINTSFNMHEEPIVYSPRDAISSFLRAKLDILVMNNFLIEKNV